MSKATREDTSNRRISSFDEYLLTYFPKSHQERQSLALSPQEFGVSIARHSLARIRDALAAKSGKLTA